MAVKQTGDQVSHGRKGRPVRLIKRQIPLLFAAALHAQKEERVSPDSSNGGKAAGGQSGSEIKQTVRTQQSAMALSGQLAR